MRQVSRPGGLELVVFFENSHPKSTPQDSPRTHSFFIRATPNPGPGSGCEASGALRSVDWSGDAIILSFPGLRTERIRPRIPGDCRSGWPGGGRGEWLRAGRERSGTGLGGGGWTRVACNGAGCRRRSCGLGVGSSAVPLTPPRRSPGPEAQVRQPAAPLPGYLLLAGVSANRSWL